MLACDNIDLICNRGNSFVLMHISHEGVGCRVALTHLRDLFIDASMVNGSKLVKFLIYNSEFLTFIVEVNTSFKRPADLCYHYIN